MIKRTIEISSQPTHLAVRDRQLLLLRKDGPPRSLPAHPPNLAASIPTEDIGMVVVDEVSSSYSHAALAELADRGAVVVVCGRDHLPTGLLLPMAEHTEVVWRLRDQIQASKPLRKQLWQTIIRAKILAQAAELPPFASAARAKLLALARDVKSGDGENHEAQAAAVYWSAWLGSPTLDQNFRREPGVAGAAAPNNLLDYGYAVLRAAVARALVAAGLLPALGLKHKNRSNVFCLADDLMEPLRPLVDRAARELFLSGQTRLTQPAKARLLLTLTATVQDRTGAGPLLVVLHRYVASLARSLATRVNELDVPVPCDTARPTPPSRQGAKPWN